MKTLNDRLVALLAALSEADKRLDESKEERAKTSQKTSDATAVLAQTETLLTDASFGTHSLQFSRIESLRSEALGQHVLTVESCDNREQDLRKWLQDRIDAEDKKRDRLQERIINAMRGFREAYPLETTEMDVSMDAANEYREVLSRLQSDDLPRFESRFKELLNENTIREVGKFSKPAFARKTIDPGKDSAHQRVAHEDRLQSRPVYRPRHSAHHGHRHS